MARSALPVCRCKNTFLKRTVVKPLKGEGVIMVSGGALPVAGSRDHGRRKPWASSGGSTGAFPGRTRGRAVLFPAQTWEGAISAWCSSRWWYLLPAPRPLLSLKELCNVIAPAAGESGEAGEQRLWSSPEGNTAGLLAGSIGCAGPHNYLWKIPTHKNKWD